MNNSTDTATYTRSDIVFALAMLVCGFLYWNLILAAGLGAGVTLFAAIFCLSTVLYLKSGKFRQTRTSWLCFIVIILSSLVFLLFDNILIKGLNFIFLTAAVIYWISLSTGRNLEKRISVYILGDFLIKFWSSHFAILPAALARSRDCLAEIKRENPFWPERLVFL